MIRKFYNLGIKTKLLIGFLIIACLSGLIALSTFYAIHLLDQNKSNYDLSLRLSSSVSELEDYLKLEKKEEVLKKSFSKINEIEKDVNSISKTDFLIKSRKVLLTNTQQIKQILEKIKSNGEIDLSKFILPKLNTINNQLIYFHKSISQNHTKITYATKVQNIALMILGTIVALSIALFLSN